MADTGDTYYCTWIREADRTCTGWEIRRPTLRVNAPTPGQLQGGLGKLISRHYNDQEAALHFDPPLRDADADPALFVDGFVEIAWNAGFWFRPSAVTAYTKGRCERCGGGIGPRSPLPLEVDAITEATGGATSPPSNEPPPCWGMPGWLMIVSGEFLTTLSKNERDTFEARPVNWAVPHEGTFYEMIPRVLVPFGAIKGEELNGWRCGRCKRRVYSHPLLGIGVKVVCRQHLPVQSTRLFFAGSPTEIRLYCTRERWRSLAGSAVARKLAGAPLAVVEASVFDPAPPLGTLDEIAAFRREHGFKVPFKPRPTE